MSQHTQKMLLIDGNSILNRAYFALPPLNDSTGMNVNAVFGFANILLRAINDYTPDKLVVAFDMRGANFRKQLYADYKANRKGMPDDLAAQMPVLHQLLALMKVTVLESPGVEADDIIGTVSTAFDGHSYIISGDRDMLQLVSPKTTVLYTKRGVSDVDVVTPESLVSTFGLTPPQIIDYKALRGDTSDNIPGVRGIGEKTATQLLAKYGTLDNIYNHLEEQTPSVRAKLMEDKDMAYVSRTLATIVTNVNLPFDVPSIGMLVFDQEVRGMMERLHFKTLIARINFVQGDEPAATQEQQVVSTSITSLQQLATTVQNTLMQAPQVAFHMQDGCLWLATSSVTQYCIHNQNFEIPFNINAILKTLQPLLENNQIAKIVYDSKALYHALKPFGITAAKVEDVAIMQYLVEYRAYKDAASMCLASGHNGDIGAGLFAASQTLGEQMRKLGVQKLYAEVELPLANLLARMEEEGVKVDVNLLEEMSASMQTEQQALAEEIFQLAGELFNLNSPKQLGVVLFEKLQLPHGKMTKKGYSTNTEVLEKIADKHPIVEKILHYRKISKLLSTYVDGLRPLVINGKVHTTFNQTLTTTGRLSSSDPNLQNIPIRTEHGKAIRKLFCSKHGTFVGADYSQIELRLLAAFSMDENLLNSFRNGEDIHTRVAAELFGVPAQLVNQSMRRTAKAVNFGIIYGISDFGLAQSANLTNAKAKEYIKLYFERFPRIKQYLDGCVAHAKKEGFVTTLTGRRRLIPELQSNNFAVRGFGERAAMNMPLQGSAADIMKIAMLKVDAAMKQANLQSKIVLQIHDELIVDCYPHEAEQVKQILVDQMQNAVSLACPLTVETEEGANLYEA